MKIGERFEGQGGRLFCLLLDLRFFTSFHFVLNDGERLSLITLTI